MAQRKWIIAAAVAALVSACAEREIILTGEREELRGAAPQVELPSETRAIRLAAQSSNASWTHRHGT